MSDELRIDYVEFPAADLNQVQSFYEGVFGWKFESYGPDYLAFQETRLAGGFYRSELCASSSAGSALIVFFAADIEATEKKIVDAGGQIVQETFAFPGGRRFHFADPAGNELAVWSDK